MCDAAISTDFVDRLAERAEEAERLRRLPAGTIADVRASGFLDTLVPKSFHGREQRFPSVLEPIRSMAHGCVSSAWTLGFYALHNWMLALFPEAVQREVFANGPVLCPAPLAPTGRGEPAGDGVRLSGRWSWATGVMDAEWVLVGALCGPVEALYPAMVLVPAEQISVVDVWHTEGMRATGSNDVTISGVDVPAHRIVRVADIYGGTSPGASLHGSSAYRWPMVPALALAAAMPALGAAERAVELYRERLSGRVLAEGGAKQVEKPIAQAHLGRAGVRIRAMRGLVDATVASIEDIVDTGAPVPLPVRADARLAAAHVVSESRAIIADVVRASGASVHFTSHPLQRLKRDVDVLSGHVIFDYDTGSELAGALALGMRVPRTAML